MTFYIEGQEANLVKNTSFLDIYRRSHEVICLFLSQETATFFKKISAISLSTLIILQFLKSRKMWKSWNSSLINIIHWCFQYKEIAEMFKKSIEIVMYLSLNLKNYRWNESKNFGCTVINEIFFFFAEKHSSPLSTKIMTIPR